MQSQRTDLILKNLLRDVFRRIFERNTELTNYSKLKRNKDPRFLMVALNILSKEVLDTQLLDNSNYNNE